MNAYQTALKHFLAQPGVKQEDVATRIGKSQAAINRYANGRRFPDADTARLIDSATDGVVAFKLWQSVALERLGIGESTVSPPSVLVDSAAAVGTSAGNGGDVTAATRTAA